MQQHHLSVGTRNTSEHPGKELSRMLTAIIGFHYQFFFRCFFSVLCWIYLSNYGWRNIHFNNVHTNAHGLTIRNWVPAEISVDEQVRCTSVYMYLYVLIKSSLRLPIMQGRSKTVRTILLMRTSSWMSYIYAAYAAWIHRVISKILINLLSRHMPP